jgi:tetratricopeptide (TPR) repeat protein
MGFLRKLIGGNSGAADSNTPAADGPAAGAFARGLECLARGRHTEALDEFDRALALAPDHADALSKRGGALMALGRVDEALASLDRAIRARPDHADAHFNRGVVLQGMTRFEEAAASYTAALALDPADVQAWNNRGVVLGELRRFEQALQSLQRALSLRPGYADALNNQAVVLGEMRDFAAALKTLDRALALQPGYVAAWYNRGNMLGDLGDWPGAIASYDRALALDPGNAMAHWNQGLCLLRLGDFARGWPKYEWRWEAVAGMRRAPHRQPLWLGDAPLAGRTILLHAEQGFGDTLQFCRFAAQVQALGARVLLEVQAPLRALLTGLAGVDRVWVQGEDLPHFDFHCPLMSLPLALETGPGDIPFPGGYLSADPRKVAAWGARLGTDPGLRVGVVWSGGHRPHQPVTWELNERRNMPARHLAALGLPDVRLYSLQKGPEAVAQLADLRACDGTGLQIADFTSELADFADTAALVCNLDLVISVDTSVAHLAGALGKPVWLLNRFDTCWRWMLERPDTPWYASMQIFRQPEPGDWGSVMASVRRRLAGLAERRVATEPSCPPG